MKPELIKNKVLEIFNNINETEEIFAVDVLTEESPEGKVISLLLDGDKGVNIGQCAEVSRKMSTLLDEAADFDEPFVFEVSSPGAEYPLRMYRQFPQHVGRKLSVKMTDGSEFEGKLKSVEGASFIFEVEETPLQDENKKKKSKPVLKEKSVKFDDISSALVLISFK
jgi:ribosome maturation factor RimP